MNRRFENGQVLHTIYYNDAIQKAVERSFGVFGTAANIEITKHEGEKAELRIIG
jgi:hypothetical protein